MAYLVKCNRCGKTTDVAWANVDTGYWIAPSDWLRVDANTHLCPACKTRALTPDLIDCPSCKRRKCFQREPWGRRCLYATLCGHSTTKESD